MSNSWITPPTFLAAIREFFETKALKEQQIRKDLSKLRLVIVIQPMFQDPSDLPDGHATMPYLVKDILSGRIYDIPEQSLGSYVYNEMEVLAWASGEYSDG